MIRFLLVLIGCFFFGANSFAQPFERIANAPECSINGVQLALPFSGGVNNPNHQFFDADGDGDFDLFLFEGNQSLDYYRNDGSSITPDFQLATGERTLPRFLMWYLFVDLNGDGRADLLTDDFSSNIRWYLNTGTVQNPNFTLYDSMMRDVNGLPMLGGLNSVPAFADIDHDGDVDFFSVNSASGTINFYRNSGTGTSPQFVFVTDFWQSIQIIGGKSLGFARDDTIRDNTFSTKLTSQTLNPFKHGAAALRFADIDADNDNDLFYGDLFSFGLLFFRNVNDSMFLDTLPFPAGDPVHSFGFNMPVLVDIDADNDFDLFVGGLHPGTSQNSFTFFRNTGTPSSFQFQRITNNFLPMLDVGKNSHPAFCDIDADGDKDMFIGSVDKGVLFFRNEPNIPQNTAAFVLADSNFANVSGNYDYDPVFVDIDADGDYDMFVGNFSGRMPFYKNTGTAQSPSFTLTPFPATDSIRVSQSLAPAFVDIDGDTDFDLFVGKPNGKIAFYRNVGSATNFLPVLENAGFQNITAGQYAKPFFADYDNDGDYDLFIGTSEGGIEHYENIGTAQNPQFTLLTRHFANTDAATEVDPFFVDIDDDTDLDVFVGNYHGGIQFYRNKKFSASVVHNAGSLRDFVLLQNYPNPFNPTTTIRFEIPVGAIHELPLQTTLKIYNVLGQEVATLLNNEWTKAGKHEIQFDASQLPSGIYFTRLQTENHTAVQKMVLMK